MNIPFYQIGTFIRGRGLLHVLALHDLNSEGVL